MLLEIFHKLKMVLMNVRVVFSNAVNIKIKILNFFAKKKNYFCVLSAL